MTIWSSIHKIFLIILQNIKLVTKLVILDQAAKWWFISYLKHQPNMVLKVTSFLDIVYAWNYGISFGFFRQYYQYSNYIFIGLNSIITIYIWYLLLKCKNSLEFIGYSFIIGGAVGNLIDRIFRGAVFDFIYFHYHQYGFFVFNLADSFISIGAACIAIFYYQEYKKNLVATQIQSYYDDLKNEADKIRNLENEQ